MSSTVFQTVLRNYFQTRKQLIRAEQTKFVAITQRNRESNFREEARFGEFDKLKNVADPEAYMIQLRFIAGL